MTELEKLRNTLNGAQTKGKRTSGEPAAGSREEYDLAVRQRDSARRQIEDWARAAKLTRNADGSYDTSKLPGRWQKLFEMAEKSYKQGDIICQLHEKVLQPTANAIQNAPKMVMQAIRKPKAPQMQDAHIQQFKAQNAARDAIETRTQNALSMLPDNGKWAQEQTQARAEADPVLQQRVAETRGQAVQQATDELDNAETELLQWQGNVQEQLQRLQRALDERDAALERLGGEVGADGTIQFQDTKAMREYERYAKRVETQYEAYSKTYQAYQEALGKYGRKQERYVSAKERGERAVELVGDDSADSYSKQMQRAAAQGNPDNVLQWAQAMIQAPLSQTERQKAVEYLTQAQKPLQVLQDKLSQLRRDVPGIYLMPADWQETQSRRDFYQWLTETEEGRAAAQEAAAASGIRLRADTDEAILQYCTQIKDYLTRLNETIGRSGDYAQSTSLLDSVRNGTQEETTTTQQLAAEQDALRGYGVRVEVNGQRVRWYDTVSGKEITEEEAGERIPEESTGRQAYELLRQRANQYEQEQHPGALNQDETETLKSKLDLAQEQQRYQDFLQGKASNLTDDEAWSYFLLYTGTRKDFDRYAYDPLTDREGKQTADSMAVNGHGHTSTHESTSRFKDDRYYEQMTSSERQMFNYFFNNPQYGERYAESYLEYLTPVLSYRVGKEEGEMVDFPVGRELYMLSAGFGNWLEGATNLFVDHAREDSAMDVAQQHLMEQHPSGFTHYALATAQNIGFNAPSMLAGIATGNPTIGALTIGAGAAGQAKQELLQQGGTVEQANAYGVAIGVCESAFERLFGGLPGVKGIESGKLGEWMASKVSKPLAKAVLKFTGGSLLSENFEEQAQNWIEPGLKWLVGETISGKHFDFEAPSGQEMLETLIVTTATTALTGAAEFRGDVQEYKAQDALETLQWDNNTLRPFIEETLNNAPSDSKIYQAAEQMAEKLKRGELVTKKEFNKLIKEVGDTAMQEAAEAEENGTATDPEALTKRTERDATESGSRAETTATENAAPAAEAGTEAEATGAVEANEENTAGSPVTAQELVNRVQKGATNGEQSLRGEERNAAVDSGVQTGGMAESGSQGTAQRGGEEDARRYRQENLRRQRAEETNRRIAEYGDLTQDTPCSAVDSNGDPDSYVAIVPEGRYDSELAASAQRAKAAGVQKVTVVKGTLRVNINGGMQRVSGFYNAQTRSIAVKVNSVVGSPTQLLNHETFHYMAAQDSALVEHVAEEIRKNFSQEEFRTILDGYIRIYRGVYTDEATIMEEVVADAYAGLNRLRDLNVSQYQDVARSVADSSAATSGQNAAASARRGTGDDGNRLSYAGVNAKTADMRSLREARELEEAGAAAETIREATGWFRGADGKWRFEIDDSAAEYRKHGDARLLKEDGYRRLMELTDKWAAGYEKGRDALTEAEENEMEALHEEYSDRVWEEKYEIQDFMKHDKLYEAYPMLKHATLQFQKMEAGVNGFYSAEDNTIVLSDNLIGKPEKTLLHEIQHAIQRTEGFSGGASPEYWARKDYESGDKISERLQRQYDETLNGLSKEEQNQYIRYMELDREMERLFSADENSEDGQKYAKLEAEQDALYQKLWAHDWFRKLIDLNRKIGNPGEEYTRLYKNTAGEIEARDVANRRELTAEERRKKAPDLGDENTVFAEDGAEDYSIERTTDGRRFVEIDRDILDGVPRKNWIRAVKQNLKEKFPNGIAVGNNVIKIDKQSREEITLSEYTKSLYKTDNQLAADKLRATDNSNEVLAATEDWVEEEIKHPRKDKIIKFARGKVLMRIGERDYTAEVLVGTHKSGKLTMYDVVNLTSTSFKKKETNAAIAGNPLTGVDRKAASVSSNSIRQEGQKSQEVFSKNRASLEEITDEATDKANRYRWRIELNGRECTVEADTIGSALHEAADALSVSYEAKAADMEILSKELIGKRRLSTETDGSTKTWIAEFRGRRIEVDAMSAAEAMEKAVERMSIDPEAAERELELVQKLSPDAPEELRDLEKREADYERRAEKRKAQYRKYYEELDSQRMDSLVQEFEQQEKQIEEMRSSTDELRRKVGEAAEKFFSENLKEATAEDYGADRPLRSRNTTLSPREAVACLEALTGKKWNIQESKFGEWKAVQTRGTAVPTMTAEEAKSRLEAAKRVGMNPVAKTKAKGVKKINFRATEALEKLGVKIDGSVVDYEATPQIVASYEAKRRIDRSIEKLIKKRGISAKEKSFAWRIAKGEYQAMDIPRTMRYNDVVDLANLYMDQRMSGEDLLKMRKRAIRDAVFGEILERFPTETEIQEGTVPFRHTSLLQMQYRTAKRNMLHIFGDEAGARLNEYLFDPVKRNTAERTRWMNKEFDAVRKFAGQDGKMSALNQAESAYVHMAMEMEGLEQKIQNDSQHKGIFEAVERLKKLMPSNANKAPTEKALKAGMEEAIDLNLGKEQRAWMMNYARFLAVKEGAKENVKVDLTKCENAQKAYRERFDNYYRAIVDFLAAHGEVPIGKIEFYTPHMSTPDKINLLSGIMEKLGFNGNAGTLPAAIAGRTEEFRPNKRWTPFFQSRTGDKTSYDIVPAFESYVSYVSDVLFHYDDIRKLRLAEDYLRAGTAGDFVGAIQTAIDLSKAGTYDEKIEFLQEIGRLDADVLEADYDITKGAVDEALDTLIDDLISEKKNSTRYSDMVVWLNDYTNILAGKQYGGDRGLEHNVGRTGAGRNFLGALKKVVNTFATSKVAGNLSSALNQVAQLPMLKATRSQRSILQAIGEFATGKLKEFRLESDFLTGKTGVDYLQKSANDRILEVMFAGAEFTDSLLSTIATRAAYLDAISGRMGLRQMDHEAAMRFADDYGSSLMGDRTMGAKPNKFQSKSPFWQIANMFQIEALNSWEFVMKDMPQHFREIEAEYGKGRAARTVVTTILKALLSAFVLNRLTEELYGGTPAPFDIAGLTAGFISSGYGLSTNDGIRTLTNNISKELFGSEIFEDVPEASDSFDLGNALSETGQNVLNDVPFAQNIAGIMGWGDETTPMQDLYSGLKNVYNAMKDGVLTEKTGVALLKLMADLIPGGNQLQKTVNGLRAISSGGRMQGYGDDERLQYLVGDDAYSKIRAVLFGPYSSPEARAYFASNDKGLGKNETAIWKKMRADGADPEEVYNLLKDAKKDGRSLTQKQAEVWEIMKNDGADGMTLLRLMLDMRAVDEDEDTTKEEKAQEKRNLIRASELDDEQKAYLFAETIGKSETEDFAEQMEAGMSWDDVMEAYEQYKKVYSEEDLSSSEKQLEMAVWIDEHGYSKKQRELVKDCYKYYTPTPGNTTTYDKYVAAGLKPEDAKSIVKETKRLAGEEDISLDNKIDAIFKQGLSENQVYQALGTVMDDDAFDNLAEAKAAGISCETYVRFKRKIKDVKSEKNDRGKDIKGKTRKDKIMKIINEMNLTNDQKDALYLLAGYAESTIRKAPWR